MDWTSLPKAPVPSPQVTGGIRPEGLFDGMERPEVGSPYPSILLKLEGLNFSPKTSPDQEWGSPHDTIPGEDSGFGLIWMSSSQLGCSARRQENPLP